MRTNTTALRLSAGALALFMALSPLAGYAKEKENKENKGKKAEVKVELEAKKESRENKGNGKKVVTAANVTASTSTSTKSSANKSCIKAFGHLIAPGWIKKNGSSTIATDCWLPFGIAKKFQGPNPNGNGTGTTTPDTTGPVIGSINTSPKQTTVNITWLTDEKADSMVFYATSSGAVDVNSSTTARVSKSSLEKDHNVKIENLATSTTYYFRIASKDASGNVSYSNTFSFNTLAPDVIATYPVISQIVTATGTSTVNIAWKTNENATSKVYYGTTTPNTNSSTTAFVLDSTLVTNHSVLVSGLSTSTAYTFVIESKNAQGNDTLSNSFTITTNN
jgi:hypothetical protein